MLSLKSDFIRHSLISLERELTSPFQCSLRSLPPLLGLRPETKGTYPLGIPNSVTSNAVALVGGSATPHDHIKPLEPYSVLIQVPQLLFGRAQ